MKTTKDAFLETVYLLVFNLYNLRHSSQRSVQTHLYSILQNVA